MYEVTKLLGKSLGWPIFVTMKKWILLAAALLGCIAAQAQRLNGYYLGGDISFTASSYGTRIVVYPEIGKRVTDNLYAGIAAGGGYYSGNGRSDFSMGFTPHLRGYWYPVGGFGLSGDLHGTYRVTRRRGYDPLIKTVEAGLRPGLVIPLGNGTSITAQAGFFGWSRSDYGDGVPSSRWIARLEAQDVLFGVLMNL